MTATLIDYTIKHIHCPALSALVQLQQTNPTEFAVALAGGCVRDAVFDKKPNDHDIVLYGYGDEIEFHSDMYVEVLRALRDAGYEYERYDVATEYGNARVYAVLQMTHPVFPNVDVLFHPEYDSVADILDNHDFNINGFCVSEDSDGVQFGFALNNWGILNGILQPCRGHDTPSVERTQRMIDYAYSVGWGVSQPTRDLLEQE